jgi:hypothetical protein
METSVLAGWAEAEITPGIPCRMGGYGSRAASANAVHDPLHVYALALGTPERPLVVITCDLIGVDETMVEETRRNVAQQHPGAITWLGATHTHSGPDVTRSLSFSSEQPDSTMKKLVLMGAESAAGEAITRMHPVWVRRASGPIDGVATNRDHPEQAADMTLDLLCFYDAPEQAQPVAIFGSFPCHPTVMSADNLAISADLPGAFRRQLRALLGGNAWIALATGAAGDISTRHTRQGQGFDELERIGALLAQQASNLILAGQPLALAAPDVREAVVSLEPKASISSEELVAHARRIQERMNTERQAGNIAQLRTLETTLQGIQAAQKLTWKEQPRTIKVSVALMGKLALAAVPGELYNRLGAVIKLTTKQFVLLLGYTNGYVGYIPSREAYAELDYEILISPFAPGSGERLAQTLQQLLRDV